MLQRIESMDRRYVFLCIVVSVLIPLVLPIGLESRVTEPVRAFHEVIESVPAGSTILMSADWDPGSLAELYPLMLAILRHLFDRQVRVVIVTLWPTGPRVIWRVLQEAAADRGLTDGVDYTFLGFKEGRQAVMVAMGANIPNTFPRDYHDRPVSELPIMEGILNYNSFPLFINISAGFPGTKEYVQQVQSRYGVRMLSACAGVSAPEYYPYYKAGQLIGLLGGLKAGAEYEGLIGHPGRALRSMDAQSTGHFMIVLLIVVGNVLFFIIRRTRAPR